MEISDDDLLKEVKRRFIVRPKEGKIFWKLPPRNYPGLKGKEAGTLVLSGKWYRCVKICGRVVKSARIIFLYAKGRLPRPCVDHKNGDSLNDAISNLREASHRQNAHNRKIGAPNRNLPMGVRLMDSGRFQARITFDGDAICLGTFEGISEAASAYSQKRKELFGEFA